ncbi:hypothetical protein Sjap_021528 [Stephania japonica]|uniref:Thionin-like protein n=1 Tax=Stephania japonica TaxID=461633 RepID=A0AAP0HTJ7_9MAGN
MKKIALLLVVVLYLVSSETLLVVAPGPGDCLDACSTACVQYFRDPRRMARCDRKCSIRCGPAGPGDCLDACTTGCVGKYINDGRKRARCDEKCAIKCGPGAAAANNKVGTIIEDAGGDAS